MSQVKHYSVLVIIQITIWNQEFFEGFIIIGPFFNLSEYNGTVNGKIAWGEKMQDMLIIGYQRAFLGVNLTVSVPYQP